MPKTSPRLVGRSVGFAPVCVLCNSVGLPYSVDRPYLCPMPERSIVAKKLISSSNESPPSRLNKPLRTRFDRVSAPSSLSSCSTPASLPPDMAGLFVWGLITTPTSSRILVSRISPVRGSTKAPEVNEERSRPLFASTFSTIPCMCGNFSGCVNQRLGIGIIGVLPAVPTPAIAFSSSGNSAPAFLMPPACICSTSPPSA